MAQCDPSSSLRSALFPVARSQARRATRRAKRILPRAPSRPRDEYTTDGLPLLTQGIEHLILDERDLGSNPSLLFSSRLSPETPPTSCSSSILIAEPSAEGTAAVSHIQNEPDVEDPLPSVPAPIPLPPDRIVPPSDERPVSLPPKDSVVETRPPPLPVAVPKEQRPEPWDSVEPLICPSIASARTFLNGLIDLDIPDPFVPWEEKLALFHAVNVLSDLAWMRAAKMRAWLRNHMQLTGQRVNNVVRQRCCGRRPRKSTRYPVLFAKVSHGLRHARWRQRGRHGRLLASSIVWEEAEQYFESLCKEVYRFVCLFVGRFCGTIGCPLVVKLLEMVVQEYEDELEENAQREAREAAKTRQSSRGDSKRKARHQRRGGNEERVKGISTDILVRVLMGTRSLGLGEAIRYGATKFPLEPEVQPDPLLYNRKVNDPDCTEEHWKGDWTDWTNLECCMCGRECMALLWRRREDTWKPKSPIRSLMRRYFKGENTSAARENPDGGGLIQSADEDIPDHIMWKTLKLQLSTGKIKAASSLITY
ncbi:hypothetical protein MKZ38_008109 [Zalerion maritima]|uniref:Uncharacterized protein n=1 Tax=Zalerion maritima TaxID=339359 RepID=A0AAD5RVK6_9PEZI|nr:hypothetical protein MKZ38_008109 [Zalerion maritima]